MIAIVRRGAALGFKLALAYGLLFVLAATVRYSRDLAAAPPPGSLWPTWLAGVLSLAVASLGIALILGLAAAVLGALTALLAVAIVHWFKSSRGPRLPAIAGIAVAGAIVLLLHAALWNARLWSPSSLFSATYLFWLGAPAAIYLAAAYRAGREQSA